MVDPDELKAALRLKVLSGSEPELSPSDVVDACTQLLRLCHQRCQCLAIYVGSPPPIAPAQLVLAIPGWEPMPVPAHATLCQTFIKYGNQAFFLVNMGCDTSIKS